MQQPNCQQRSGHLHLAAAGLSESAEIVRHWADYERATAADYDRISNRGKPSR